MLSLLILLGVFSSIMGCIIAVSVFINSKKSDNTSEENKKDYFDD